MTGRRGLLIALSGYVLAAALMLLASGRVWGRAALVAQTGARVTASATGHDAINALSALALAVLVLGAAVVAARSWLRAVVGLITAVVGGTVVALALTSADDVAAALRRDAFGVAGSDVHASLAGWAVVAAVGGAVAVIAGALTGWRGSTWPGLGSRYESPAGAPAPAARPQEESAAAWDALDRGEDPTS